MQGPIVFLNVATNFEYNLIILTIVYMLTVVDQTMCAGATWLDTIIMFSCYCLALFGRCALLWLWVGRPCHANAFRALACSPSPLLGKGTYFQFVCILRCSYNKRPLNLVAKLWQGFVSDYFSSQQTELGLSNAHCKTQSVATEQAA